MKIIVIITGISLSTMLSVTMATSAERKLLPQKTQVATSSKMKKISFLGVIPICYVSKKSFDGDETVHVSKKKSKNDAKPQQQAVEKYIKEQNEMSACLGDPTKKNLKYALPGSMLDA